jgi:hypothetical protein
MEKWLDSNTAVIVDDGRDESRSPCLVSRQRLRYQRVWPQTGGRFAE